MHRKVVVAVSAVLFALLAVAVTLMANLHDRTYPQQLGTKSLVELDFVNSGLPDAEAIGELGRLSDRLGVGLLKVAPDLGGDQSGQVFVKVGDAGEFPARITRFGDEKDAEIRSNAALEHSYASGQYLVTGSTDRLPEFREWLTARQVIAKWNYNDLGTTLETVARQGSFLMSLLAATALMASLVLYWLSVKARGRALRALAGVSTWRIQYEDLRGFLFAMVLAAVVVDTAAVVVIGFTQGWVFAPLYLSILLVFDAIVIVVTMLCALVMSVASWPGPAMLANRDPAVKSLRGVSVVLKALTFVLVLAAVSPAYTAYANARNTALQQSHWKSLADQVALSFQAAMGENGFQEIMGKVGDVVRDAEQRDDVALSYAWNGETVEGADLGPSGNLALVNQGWLNLMLGNGKGRLAPLPPERIPDSTRKFLVENLELWKRGGESAAEVLGKFSFYHFSQPEQLPLALAGSGELVFPADAIVVVAPEVYATFDDDFLASIASTRNLVFTGLGPTQGLLAQHGLQYKINVQYAAEEGILLAQFTAYFAWLEGVSLVALLVALVVSALIAAFIAAVLHARRDFPLRLAGQRWSEILAGRVAPEWLVGAALAVMIILLRGGDGALLATAAAVLCLVASPVTHLLATRWTFANVRRRTL
ncbi:hypothetical protein [Amycolatopsis regifaucium]|uniref:Permease n=1 Tax=Amycolatopsis regifaucium TaxID=546365 RepID=A0A154MWK6_9PSEU|nr:hypothetical protein [Amycolatopsis regifaucium]KZB88706.1 hypothetical protein AVL48_01135 [Amycolatopsis regifaucium]OKA07122.1 hypothetical protein ATP06_0214650 [Amycolatopsis regifaucium]SFI57650.1 hypothetical protein SAMN04489731_111226 [Amycolatopsis regifaucium]